MSSRKQGEGSIAGKGTGVLMSGPEDSSRSPTVFATPAVIGVSELLHLSGIVVTVGGVIPRLCH